MHTRLMNIWYQVRSSLWLPPALLTLLAGLLATVTLIADNASPGAVRGGLGPFGTMSAEGARAVLTTVAGSVIAIAGVAFSITIVALTLASSQFGPRLLKTFMKDTKNQIVLGIFIATFVYSLLIMAAVRDLNGQLFVPILSVACSVILALVSLGAFIYFIHNISTSIHADNVVAAISNDLHRAVDRMVTKAATRSSQEPRKDPVASMVRNEDEPATIRSLATGYLQAIDYPSLVTTARDHNVSFTLLHRPGDFVLERKQLVEMRPRQELTEDLCRGVNRAFILGAQRTEEQDIEFAIHQMVELALRALSPGINDPFTAISCIDWLGAAISRLAEQGLPSPYHYDEDEQLRVVADAPKMSGVFDAAFSQIRQHACANVAVTVRLLETFTAIASCTDNQDVRSAIRRHADMVHGAIQPHLVGDADRNDVEERYKATSEALGGG